MCQALIASASYVFLRILEGFIKCQIDEKGIWVIVIICFSLNYGRIILDH